MIQKDTMMIADRDFQELMAKRAQTLLGLACHVSGCGTTGKIMIRPLLGELLSQSIQLEELLDMYNAGNNCKWCAFRSLTAVIKLFSDVSYEILHILHALPAYRLLPIGEDFVKDTQQVLIFTGEIILKASNRLLSEAKLLDLPVSSDTVSEFVFAEQLPSGRLPHSCSSRKVGIVSEAVTMLSTAFLNLAAESENVHSVVTARAQEYASYVFNSLSEEKLRGLELRFHSLQSLYDTKVSGTELEEMDTDLPILRGHISVVFHLLRTATLFVHYYERHLLSQKCQIPERQLHLVKPDELLDVLIGYSVSYISRYINCAKRLCHTMLNRYIEADQIEVSVPPYRGFHVRPSTLVAKLVLHYGSEVQMELDGEKYDAGRPLELFRANEKINARKRKWLAQEIDRLKLVPQDSGGQQISDITRAVVLNLAERGTVVLYEQPLQIPAESRRIEGTLMEQVGEEVGRLLAIGKIDINVEFKVNFSGDKRVLADIKLLAKSGYGEDNFGNNVSLPKKLEYLRH